MDAGQTRHQEHMRPRQDINAHMRGDCTLVRRGSSITDQTRGNRLNADSQFFAKVPLAQWLER